MSELAYENCYGVINNHIIGKSTVDNRNLALVYDPDSVYNKGDHCIHEMKYWVCNTNNTTGDWDATKWDQTRVGDELTTSSTSVTETTPYNIALKCGRFGNVVSITGRIVGSSSNLTLNTTLTTIPAGYRPNAVTLFTDDNYWIRIDPNGALYLLSQGVSRQTVYISVAFVV